MKNIIIVVAFFFAALGCTIPNAKNETQSINTGTQLRLNKAGDFFEYSVTGTINNTSTGASGKVTGSITISYYTDNTSFTIPTLESVATYNLTASDGSVLLQNYYSWYNLSSGALLKDGTGIVSSDLGSKITSYSAGASAVETITYQNGTTVNRSILVTGITNWSNATNTFTNCFIQKITATSGTTSGISTSYIVPSIGATCFSQYSLGVSTGSLNLTSSLQSYSLGI